MALFANLRADLRRACEFQDGSGLRRLALALSAPGTHAVIVYRFGRWARAQAAPLRWLLSAAYQVAYLVVRILWGIEVPRGATIGPGLYIGHFGGITVSCRAVIGRNFNLSQCATIGTGGSGEKMGAPAIGDGVYVAPGARVFGRITIGSNVKIGANAVVYKDIPDNAVVALDPGFRIISFKGNRRGTVELMPHDKRRSASTG